MLLPRLSCIFLFFAIAALSGGFVEADEVSTVTSQPGYEPPDPAFVQQKMREILSDSYYQPKKTFLQHLHDFFFRFETKAPDVPSWLGRLLFWIFMTWCIITLIAILIHFGWTIKQMLRNKKAENYCSDHTISKAADKTEEELYLLAEELAETGDYCSAIKYLMLAIFKSLDSKGFIRFHMSKTNGDYLKDFPKEHQSYWKFRSVLDIFERSIYGCLIGEKSAYNQIAILRTDLKQIDRNEKQN